MLHCTENLPEAIENIRKTEMIFKNLRNYPFNLLNISEPSVLNANAHIFTSFTSKWQESDTAHSQWVQREFYPTKYVFHVELH